MAVSENHLKRAAENAKLDAIVCLNCKKAECNGSAECFREMKKRYQKEKGGSYGIIQKEVGTP